MKIIHVDPRTLMVSGSEPPDFTCKEMVQEDGLPDRVDVLPPVTVRQDGGGYKVNSGEKYVRAVVALIEEDADCIDRRTGQTGRAAVVYETIPVGLLG